MPALVLSLRQQKIVASALSFLGVAAILALLYGLFLLVSRFVAWFSPVLMPLVVAAILALILRPYYRWVLRFARWPWLAAGLVLVSVLLPIVMGLWFFGAMITAQVQGLLERFPMWLERGTAWYQAHLPQWAALWEERGAAVTDGLRARSDWIAQQLATLARGVFSAGMGAVQMVAGLFSWLMLPVYLFFLLTARELPIEKWGRELPFLKEETRTNVLYLGQEFVNILIAFFRGQFLVAGAQGLLYATGFGLAGLQYGVAIGLMLGFLNIIPYLGNIIGLGVALPLAYFQPGGGWDLLFIVLAVFLAVQCVEALYLTPKIMGDRTGLHPMAVIFSLFFWGTAFGGITGMLLGIPLTAFLVVFWRLLKSKYINEVI